MRWTAATDLASPYMRGVGKSITRQGTRHIRIARQESESLDRLFASAAGESEGLRRDEPILKVVAKRIFRTALLNGRLLGQPCNDNGMAA